jgi:site-specific DNA-methyltransferase (adenine-specific)
MKPYYQDGLATIYHGDCNEVMPRLPDGSVKLVIADPPYGISYRSGLRQISFDFIEGDKTYPADWLKAIRKTTHDSATLYVFCNDRSFDVARLALYESKFELKKTLVWDKMSVTAGDLENYGDRVEYILFANKYYKPRLRGSRDGNIISIPRVYPPSLRHPTEKPELLMSYLVMKSTDPGELILDPFMGVGPVLVAAKKLGRRIIGIEKEERFCEVAANDLRQSHFYGNLFG